jgi:ATP-dependent RNA helicase DDX47/RRP3
LVTQYDVELYQRIEELLGKKLDSFPAEEETVMVMYERVAEAQRHAAIQLREMQDRRGGKGGGRDFGGGGGKGGKGSKGGKGGKGSKGGKGGAKRRR